MSQYPSKSNSKHLSIYGYFHGTSRAIFGKDFLQNPGISVDVIIFVDAFFKDPKILNNVKLNVS